MIQPGSIFAMPIGELTRWGPGETLSAKKLNQPLEAVEAIARGIPQPRQVVPPRRGGAVASAATRFVKVDSIDITKPKLVKVQFLKFSEEEDPDGNPLVELVDDGAPTDVFCWPDQWPPDGSNQDYKELVGRPDILEARQIAGNWFLVWKVRFTLTEPDEAIPWGICT